MQLNRKKYGRLKRVTALILVVVIMGGIVGNDTLSDFIDWLRGMFTTSVSANSEGIGEPRVHTEMIPGGAIPDCEFDDKLYTGEKKVNKLPKQASYKDSAAPLRISLSDFQWAVGTSDSFDLNAARAYQNGGYKIMICDAAELYELSCIVNLRNGAADNEKRFYLHQYCARK